MATRSKEEVVQEFRIQSIQDAAMRVIAHKGIAGATMQDIAEEAGVAKGTIYLYFRDRDDLVEKTFETAITQLHGLIDKAWAGGNAFEEKLRATIAAKFEFFRENREFFRLYASLRIPEGDLRDERREHRHRGHCQEQYRARIDLMGQALAEAMERGEVRRMNPKRLALFIIEATNSVVIERIMENESPPEPEDIDLVTSVIFDGIGLRTTT